MAVKVMVSLPVQSAEGVVIAAMRVAGSMSTVSSMSPEYVQVSSLSEWPGSETWSSMDIL